MKLEYTELIVFKSGVTTLMTKIYDVDGIRNGHAYLSDKEGDRIWISEERIDSGSESANIMLSRGKIPLERVDYCLADIKKVE